MQSSSTFNLLCPECGSRPITPGYNHCSRQCALGSSSTPPIQVPVFISPPVVPTPPPAPRSRRQPRLCPECGVNPVNPGYKHCSKECAVGPLPSPAATPRKRIKTCEHCQTEAATPPYRFCSPKCGHAHRRDQALTKAMGSLNVGPRACLIKGCTKTEWKPGSKYCGDTHRAAGVTLKLEPACLLCTKYPKMDGSAFCSPHCRDRAESTAPLLLPVPSDDPTFKIVANQFRNEWKHTPTPPEIRFLYRIVYGPTLKAPFERRRDTIEKVHGFEAKGMLEANERRRWHGTRRECLVGDPGASSLVMCNSSSCSICIIMRNSFDVTKCRSGCMFGTGIYTSGTSSKSDGYVRQGSSYSSPYKAMLLTRVLAGNAQKLTVADQSLTQPLLGFDSVRGVPGDGLLYDELIVYEDDLIRPFYLVIYDK